MNLPQQDDLLADEDRIFGLFADANTSLDLDGQLLLARLNEQIFKTPRDAEIRIGRYHVDRLLGEGGMGRVYLAHDPNTGGLLAVKVLRFSGLSPELRARAQRVLRREARVMANLRAHPNIVVVYDIDETDDQVAVAMQYIEGEDLRAWQRGRRGRWREIVDMYLAVARGLAHAHLNRIVHGDFKPDNVLVDVRHQPHITDFGLARSLEIAEGDELDHAETALAAGTPEYMAPEQFNRQPSDHASDQFSFCVALFEALLGVHPYATTTFGALAETLRSGGREVSEELVRARYVTDLVKTMHRGEIQWPRGAGRLPRWLRAVLARGLDSGPSARFASMTELIAEVERCTRRARRVRLGLATLGLITVSALGTLAWAEASRVAQCDAAGVAIAGVWNDGERAALREKFGDAAAPVLAAADRYATAWQSTATELCRRTHIVGDQSPALMDTRMACLDLGRHEFAALRERVKELGDAETASSQLAWLAAPEDCAEATGIHPLPRDRDERAALDRHRSASAAAFIDEIAERYTDALREADDAVAAADASAYPPALVHAYFRRGRIGVRAALYATDSGDPASRRARGVADLKTAYVLGMSADPRVGTDAYVFLQRLLAREGEGDAAILGDVARMTGLAVDGPAASLDLVGFTHRLGLSLERRATYLDNSGMFHTRRVFLNDDPALDRSAARREAFIRARRDFVDALALRRLLAGIQPQTDDAEAPRRRASEHARLLQNAADASIAAASEYLIFGAAGDDLSAADAQLRDAEQYYEEAQRLWRDELGPDAPVVRELILALADLAETRWRAASRRAAEGRGSATDVEASRRAIEDRLDDAARRGETGTALVLRRARLAFGRDLEQAEGLAAEVLRTEGLTAFERCAGLEALVGVRLARERRDHSPARLGELRRDTEEFADACASPSYRVLVAAFRARLQLLTGDPTAARAALDAALATERLYPDARFYASLDLVQAELDLARHEPTRDRAALTTALARAEAALQRARYELPAEVGFEWGTVALADLNRAMRELRPGAQ